MYGIRRVTVISFFATDVMEVENHYLDWTSQVAHKGKGPSPSLRAKKRNVIFHFARTKSASGTKTSESGKR